MTRPHKTAIERFREIEIECEELMQAYWGPGGTVDMVNEYNAKHGCDVKPWECVRNSLIHIGYKEHPTFIDRADPKNNGESCPVFKESKE